MNYSPGFNGPEPVVQSVLGLVWVRWSLFGENTASVSIHRKYGIVQKEPCGTQLLLWPFGYFGCCILPWPGGNGATGERHPALLLMPCAASSCAGGSM